MTTDPDGASLTVIVPVLDRIGTIDRCMRSIISQAGAPGGIEIVAVDNGSTDGTRQRLDRIVEEARMAGVAMRVLDESRPGAAAARNAGLAATRTELVMHFDSDDYMLPGHIQRVMDSFRAHPDAEIVAFPSYEADGSGRRILRRFLPGMVNQLHHSVLSTEQYAVRTALLRKVGGWDAGLRAWDDLELGVRLMLATDRIVEAPGGALVVSDISTRSTDSITGRGYVHGRGRWEVAIDKIDSHLKDTEWSIHARGIRAKLAALYAREGRSDLAGEQLAVALDGLPLRQRAVIAAAYHTLRITGHGASWLMTRFLRP